MKKSELYFIWTQSPLGALVDPSPLIEASQNENMLPLVGASFTEHQIGLFVTLGLGKEAPVLGYIACKNIGLARPFVDCLGITMPDAPLGRVATIGGLYLDKQLRGKGIAQQLVHEITDRVFTNFFDIQACVASCNSASYKAFASYDYRPMSASQMAIEPSNGKIPLLARRDRWINYRNYQTMYNKGSLWTT